MTADQIRLRGRLRSLRARARQKLPIDKGLAEIGEVMDASIARRERRERMLPTVRYPQDLPISERREEIAEAIRDHQVVVVAGETGSGKSTQLPKICMELGRGVAGLIAHTQPRRIAARSIAARLGEELRLGIGRGVGYKVRFSDKTSDHDFIRVLTDGMLLAETQGDRDLTRYDTIIIDEAHERSLNIDFLLGYLKHLLERRPELKVIVTSATIDTKRFSEHFSNAPIIEVSGRMYPVETRYRPPSEDFDERERMTKAILHAVDEFAELGEGDVLVFLPGEREIREAANALSRHHPPNTEILPLYARLSVEEQQRVFAPHRGRRIVIATNVAETSLTVPGIRFVVDSGTARISRYSHRTKVQRLEIEPISRASANQRSGRCGRIAPGTCIRLYDKDEFESRQEYTQPEILRSNLAGVILQMKSLKLGRVEKFPFVEPPDPKMIREGYRTLHELGAVDIEGELTEIGRQLSRLPIDPRIGRMILGSGDEDCVMEVLVIASALSIQDPRDRPADKRDQADAAHEPFVDDDSDFLTYMHLWEVFHERKKHLSHRKLAGWARTHFLSHARLREWEDVHRQLREIAGELGLHAERNAAEPEAIHRALLAGLISNVGRVDEGYEYQGTHGSRFHLFPGSTLFEEKPQWVMAAELVRTTRLYARTCAKIRPKWIERYAGDLVTKTHGPPRWDSRRARVVADERVSLYGLEVVPKREVHFGPINPEIAREVFIHNALVESDLRTRAPFMRHNKRLIEQISRLEDRLRRRDLLAERTQRFKFFDRIIPEDVFTGGEFERWRRIAEKKDPELLFLSEDDVLAATPSGDELRRFPEKISINGSTLPVRYRFEPNAGDDGVTVTVPADAFTSLEPKISDWSIPGLVREKVIDLIRTLPKEYRKQIGPAPEFVDAFLAGEPRRDLPIIESLTSFILKQTGTRVPEGVWMPVGVAEHLRINYRVVDDAGSVLAISRDPGEIRRAIRKHRGTRPGDLYDERFDREDLQAWDFGELPVSIEVDRGGMATIAHPALLARGGHVGLGLVEDAIDAQRRHREGLVGLLRIVAGQDLEKLTRKLPDLDELGVLYAPLGEASEMRDDALRLLIEHAALESGKTPRDGEAFAACVESLWANFSEARSRVLPVLRTILVRRQEVALELERDRPGAWETPMRDLRAQFAAFAGPRFVRGRSLDTLRQFPRYLAGMSARLTRLARGGFERDRQAMEELSEVLREYAALRKCDDATPAFARSLGELRWRVEELRVALFAQELGTREPVSAKRVLRAIERARSKE